MMALTLRALLGLKPKDDDEADLAVDYNPAADLAETPAGSRAPRTRRGRHPETPGPGSRMKWALSRVANHVTFSDKRMVAWYLLDPQRWSFRTVADGEALIEAFAAQVAELVGRTVYGRITTRPIRCRRGPRPPERTRPHRRRGSRRS